MLASLLLRGEAEFDPRAFEGSAEPNDCGLNALVGDVPVRERKRLLREALAEFIRMGGAPNRREVPGTEHLDSELRYEFRVEFASTMIYVKTVWNDDDRRNPCLIVKCVKLKD